MAHTSNINFWQPGQCHLFPEKRWDLTHTTGLSGFWPGSTAAAARLATIKLQELYSRQGVAFLTPFDFQNDIYYLPTQAVVRLDSSSTTIRVCESPNSQYSTKYGLLSLNNCLQQLNNTNPRMILFPLSNLLMICNLKADVANMYGSIGYDYLSSLYFVTYCFRSRQGRPTYVESSSDKSGLHPIRCCFLRFGPSQSPAVSQFCLLQCVKVYYNDHNPLNPLDLFYYSICKEIIQHYTFFDNLDVCVYLHHVVQYCQLITWDQNMYQEKKNYPW